MALEFVEWFASDDHSVRPQHKAPEVVEALRQALAQPEQEPVAWLYQTAYGDKFIHKKEQAAFHEPNGTFTPLYTAPPKRKWVGLTRDEIDYCFEQCVIRKFKEDGTEEGIVSIYKAVEVIEAELKEKNT
jgi:hypothetical protein